MHTQLDNFTACIYRFEVFVLVRSYLVNKIIQLADKLIKKYTQKTPAKSPILPASSDWPLPQIQRTYFPYFENPTSPTSPKMDHFRSLPRMVEFERFYCNYTHSIRQLYIDRFTTHLSILSFASLITRLLTRSLIVLTSYRRPSSWVCRKRTCLIWKQIKRG